MNEKKKMILISLYMTFSFLQELFIRAVFSRRRTQSVTAETMAGETRASYTLQQSRDRDMELHNPVRIIHKEQDSIAAFCLNKVMFELVTSL